MTTPNVAFVNLPTISVDGILGGTNVYPAVSMPLGIMYLSSAIKESAGVKFVELIDYNIETLNRGKYGSIENFISNVARDSVERSPDILAVSFMFSFSVEFFRRMMPILREMWPDTTVVVGGMHATNDVHGLLARPDVDWVARGEAELGFAQFIRQMAEGVPPDVRGFFNKTAITGHGTRVLDRCLMVEDLDRLPFPDWDLLDMDAYVNSPYSRKRNFGAAREARMASIMTSRGCPFHCTFCSSHTVHGREMRYRSQENVLEEIRILNKRWDVNLFVPEDDMFTIKKERIVGLLDAIDGLNIENMEMQFPNALSVNTLDKDVIEALRRAGMSVLTLAIESGSDYVQKHIIKKRCSLDRARDLVAYAVSHDIYVRCYFILGFPGETVENMKETVAFARDLGADWCEFMVAMPLIGSEMFQEFSDMGVLSNDDRSWTGTYRDRSFDTPEISADDLEKLAYRANLDVNFINNAKMRSGNYKKALVEFEDVLVRHTFHIIALYCKALCHKHMGDSVAAVEAMDRIHHLIETDGRSRKMFDEYGDLISWNLAWATGDQPSPAPSVRPEESGVVSASSLN